MHVINVSDMALSVHNPKKGDTEDETPRNSLTF